MNPTCDRVKLVHAYSTTVACVIAMEHLVETALTLITALYLYIKRIEIYLLKLLAH